MEILAGLQYDSGLLNGEEGGRGDDDAHRRHVGAGTVDSGE